MAKFVYRMQNILNLKQMLETQEKAEFALAAAKEADERKKLADLFARKGDYDKHLSESLDSDRIDLKEVNFYRNAQRTIKSMIRDQMFEVKKAQQALELERQKLDEVMKDRKTHEKLKEKAFDEFRLELIAEDNKANDELTSYRYTSR
ncbi:MAG: flagellar export protein FliJ [Lachnospiraceae bacterium]|nr:flagellar export protein FliJ [Lachnospiraceae bacterium]MDD7327983.1 flagellar export protein FliJ [Lachnospiraceae bacterium]MDY2760418.1 flagellar export protein FliJ [Lachnospiraceae bacterium]